MKLLSSMEKLARKRKVIMTLLVMTSMRRNPFILATKLATKTLILMDLLASKTSGKTATKTLTPKPQNPHVYVCGVINNRASLIIIIA